MLSGGFEIWGYDVSLSHLDDNISDAANSVYENVLEPAGEAAVWAWEAERDFYGDIPNHPENILAAIPVVNLLSVAGIISCNSPAQPAKKTELPLNVPIDNFEIINNRPILSGRDFDALYNKGIDDYAGTDLGTCVMNLDQASFDFWCYGIKDAKLFEDNDWFSDDDGWCERWRVYNPQDRQPVCGNQIFHTTDWWNWSDISAVQWSIQASSSGPVNLDDDYDDIFYVLKRMEERNAGGIPGIAWWDADLVEAARCFVDPAKIIRHNQNARRAFLDFFKSSFTEDFSLKLSLPPPQVQAMIDGMRNIGPEVSAIISGLIGAQNPNLEEASSQLTSLFEDTANLIAAALSEGPSEKDLLEQEIYFELAAAGAKFDLNRLTFDTPWRTLESHSGRNDWVTPLIHAGAVYEQMVEMYESSFKKINSRLAGGELDAIFDDDGTLYIVEKNKTDPSTGLPLEIEVGEYVNEFIWRKQGERHETIRTALLREINTAVVLSKERCYNCAEEHYWAKELLKYIGYMNDGIPFNIPSLTLLMDDLSGRAHRRTQTVDDCCHQNPPSFLDETSGLCSTGTNAYEHCYAMQPPRMFEEQNCGCSQEAGATICMNLPPRGTRIFVMNPETRTSECVPCEDPTPITRDGVTCVRRPQRTTRRPRETTVEPTRNCRSPTPNEIISGVTGLICQ